MFSSLAAEEITDSPTRTSNSNGTYIDVDDLADSLALTTSGSGSVTSISGQQNYDCDISLGALWNMVQEFHSIEKHPAALKDHKTNFMDLLVSEAFRIGFFIEVEENHQERDAKALLSTIDDCLMKPFIDGMGATAYLKMKAKAFAVSSLHLHSFRLQAKENLRDVAFQGDKLMGTDCELVLTKKLSVAPWRASSTLAVVLSDVHEAIRSAQSNLASGAQKWEAPSSFQRATTKYWVEEDNLLELLLACVKEVPLLVYGRSGRLTLPPDLTVTESDKLWKALASPISSVYFDSPKMSLYNERIARKEGAQLLRVRWYGKKPKGDEKVCVELKTHHEKWINTASVKERVTIKEKDMQAFLERKPWGYQDAEPIVREGNPKFSADELGRGVDLLMRMHDLVLHHDLRPCVRSVYLRAAFQSPTTNALRLTIDRDITMIDETGTATEDWCLPDDAIDPSRIKRVPFPVFEVKLAGSEMPASIATLIAA
jgi:VTC domain